MTRLAPRRLAGWSLLALGLMAGLVLPHPVTTALWTAAARAFRRAGDETMVRRLTSAPKFGPALRRGLEPRRRGLAAYSRPGLA